MENINQPAFPTHHNGHKGGLTKREYFAGLAMQAIISAVTEERSCGIIHNIPNDIAELSCLYADALLAELEKEESNA